MSAANVPRIISWNTLRCPLKCAHCYVDAGEQEAEGVLSTEEAFGVMDQICETGKLVVVLSGGEPLIREDIWDLADHAALKGIKTALSTNGTLITADIAHKLKESRIEYGESRLTGAGLKPMTVSGIRQDLFTDK